MATSPYGLHCYFNKPIKMFVVDLVHIPTDRVILPLTLKEYNTDKVFYDNIIRDLNNVR